MYMYIHESTVIFKQFSKINLRFRKFIFSLNHDNTMILGHRELNGIGFGKWCAKSSNQIFCSLYSLFASFRGNLIKDSKNVIAFRSSTVSGVWGYHKNLLFSFYLYTQMENSQNVCLWWKPQWGKSHFRLNLLIGHHSYQQGHTIL